MGFDFFGIFRKKEKRELDKDYFFPPAWKKGSRKKANYGEPVKFESAEFFDFPDFSITYTGRAESTPSLNKGLLLQDWNFKAIAGKEEVETGFSPGTGLIGPSFFKIAEKEFVLEMFHSEILGKFIAHNLFVVSKKADFLEARSKHSK